MEDAYGLHRLCGVYYQLSLNHRTTLFYSGALQNSHIHPFSSCAVPLLYIAQGSRKACSLLSRDPCFYTKTVL